MRTLFPDWVVMVCRVQHPGVPYISPNAQYVLGYPAGELTSMSPESYFSLVHPQDIAAVRSCLTYMHQFTALPGCSPTKYRFVFHYRFKQPDNEYIYIHDEKLAIQSQYNRTVFFTLFNKYVYGECFGHVKLEIYEHRLSGIVKITELNPHTGGAITAREQKIMQLICTGLSCKEIGERLSISPNTVKTHRAHLFRKLNVQNRGGTLSDSPPEKPDSVGHKRLLITFP